MKKITITFLALFIGAYGLFSQANWEWTMQESGTTAHLNDVYFVDNMTGWAVGYNGTILKTSDGGTNWSDQISSTDEELTAVHFIDENTGWCTGRGINSLQAPLLKTTDGGDNWQLLTYDFTVYVMQDIFFVDEMVGWVIKFDSIYRSTDGGLTWIAENFVTNVEGPLNNKEIFATSDSIAFVAGRRKISGSSKTATVFDRRAYNAPNLWGTDGLNQFDNGDELQCITFANDSVGFVGGQNGKVFRMQIIEPGLNNGPWDLNMDTEIGSTIRSISFPNSTVGMFNTSTDISGVPHALVYHTEDQGESWTSIPDTIPDMLLAKLFAPDENNAWIVASSGKIYKGVPSPSSIFEKRPEINLQVFPNPTSGLLTINNPDGYSKLTISVVNITGQIISEFIMENAGAIEINIDGNPGIYFVKAINEKGGQRIIKVIKE